VERNEHILSLNSEWKHARDRVRVGRGLTVQRMMKLGRVSRSGFYRFQENGQPEPDRDMELRDAIQGEKKDGCVITNAAYLLCVLPHPPNLRMSG
jgi:hypothetical protein